MVTFYKGTTPYVGAKFRLGDEFSVSEDADGIQQLNVVGGSGGEPTAGYVSVGDDDSSPALADTLQFEGSVVTVDPVSNVATFSFDSRYRRSGVTIPWSDIGTAGRPTTLNGYGITDAYTRTQLQTAGASSFAAENLTGTIAWTRVSAPASLVYTDAQNIFTAYQRIERTLAGHTALQTQVTGDAALRFMLRVDGEMRWGDGVNPYDTTLRRSAANVLKTDDYFEAFAYRIDGFEVIGSSRDIKNVTMSASLLTSGTIPDGRISSNISRVGHTHDMTAFFGTLPVSKGGTGQQSFSPGAVLMGNPAGGNNPIQEILPGASGGFLTSNNGAWVRQTGIQWANITPPGNLPFTDANNSFSGVNTFTGGIVGERSVGGGVLHFKVPGDAFMRFTLDSGGEMRWGPGNADRDTNLYRSAANVLKTDDYFEAFAFRVDGLEVIGSSRDIKNVTMSASLLTSGTIPDARISSNISRVGHTHDMTAFFGTLGVSKGGTGQNSFSAGAVLVGNAAGGSNPIQEILPGASGGFITSNNGAWTRVSYIPIDSVAAGFVRTDGTTFMTGPIRAYPNNNISYGMALAGMDSTSSLVTGAIVVHTGIPQSSNSMFNVRIVVYEYSTNGTTEFTVQGYSYSSSTSIPQARYWAVGARKQDNVRVGYNASGNIVIVLGEGQSGWSYPKVVVQTAQLGHGDALQYLNGWSVGVDSTLTGMYALTHCTNTDLTPWSFLSGVPTTLAGYGINDAYTRGVIDALLFNKVDKNSALASFTPTIIGAGSSTGPKYGTMGVTGSTSNYAGFQFQSVGRTFMVRPDHQGIYDYESASPDWLWRFSNGVLEVGYIPWDRITNTHVASPTFANLTAGDLAATGTLVANAAGMQDAGGLSLYSSASQVMVYGIAMRVTSAQGTYGQVTGSWATYFSMSGSSRGWIFRDGTNNVASISNAGDADFREVRAKGWFRSQDDGEGLYSDANGYYWFAESSAGKWVSRSTSGIVLRNVSGSNRGYVHFDESGNFGLLNSGGEWRVQVSSSGSGNILHGGWSMHSGSLTFGDMGVTNFGTLVIRGRVFSSSSNFHISPPNGLDVVINTQYRDAGGATGGVAGLMASGDITARSASTSPAMIGAQPTYGETYAAFWRKGNTYYAIMTSATHTYISSNTTTASVYIRRANTTVAEFNNLGMNLIGDASISGTATATTFFTSSSRELKTDIRRFVGNALDIIRRTEIVSFRYRSHPVEPHIGFIAEDAPIQLVTRDRRSMKQSTVSGVLMAGVQELENRVQRLESENAQLRARLARMN